MNPNDFRLFLEVAELGSFTKAAAQRQTVQSHISRQISELEGACGGTLFRRTGRGVVLTDLGQHIETRVRSPGRATPDPAARRHPHRRRRAPWARSS